MLQPDGAAIAATKHQAPTSPIPVALNFENTKTER